MPNFEKSTEPINSSNKKPLSRRDFLKTAGVSLAGIASAMIPLSAVSASSEKASPNDTISSLSPETTLEKQPTCHIGGIPESVNRATVDFAKVENGFKNTLGLGTEMCLAEPGVILFGPDMSVTEAKRLIEMRKGYYFSPLNQIPLTACTVEGKPQPTAISLDEGAYTVLTGAKLGLKVGNIDMALDGDPKNNWMVILRGKFPDGKQDLDKNSTVIVKDFIPGHAQAMRTPPGAFVSEEFFLQNVKSSHTGLGGVTGNEGASKLNVLMVDINTGGIVWVEHIQKQDQPGEPWSLKYTNIK